LPPGGEIPKGRVLPPGRGPLRALDVGLDRVCGNAAFLGFAFAGDQEMDGGRGGVQDHHCQPSVRVGEGYGLETAGRPLGFDPTGARMDKAAELADAVEGEAVVDVAGLRVDDHGRVAEVPHVVGTACLVEDDVPVDPAAHPVPEVVDHAVRVPLPVLPLPHLLAAFPATLGEEDRLFGIRIVRAGFRREVVAYIPVYGRSPDEA